MDTFNARELVTRLFTRLRNSGFSLGMSEYLAALRTIEGRFAETPEELAETLQLLWCSSLPQQSQFELIWDGVLKTQSAAQPSKPKPTEPDLPERSEPVEPIEPKIERPPVEPSPEPQSRSSQLEPLPVQAPFLPVESEFSTLQAYYPISRRSMAYTWRYLRRMVADGAPTVLDLDATVAQVAQQGFFLAPVYRRQERNEAKLLLLVDQNGSMVPFHRFTRDLVETVVDESGLSEENVRVVYFQNVPAEQVYRDRYLTELRELQEFLSVCDAETSVLVVSDAGAARGYRKLDRIRATTRFLFQLKRHTALVAWLNPMPLERWEGSSAEIIANLVPMYQMDKDGLSHAIDVVRGQPLQALQSLTAL